MEFDVLGPTASQLDAIAAAARPLGPQLTKEQELLVAEEEVRAVFFCSLYVIQLCYMLCSYPGQTRGSLLEVHSDTDGSFLPSRFCMLLCETRGKLPFGLEPIRVIRVRR